MFRSPPRALERPTILTMRSRVAAALLLAAACVLAAGCDKGGSFLRVNQPPTIELTSGPIDTLSSPLHWIVEITWTANDPDGSIDHFEYAIDPPTLKQARFALVDTVWTSTTENHATVRFRATVPDTLDVGASATSFHTFVLRAIDDRGAASPLIIRAFYATTVAPDIQITRPVPSSLIEAYVPVPFRVDFTSNDPDGDGSHQPAFHRWRVVTIDDPGDLFYILDPDTLIRLGFQTDWEGWETVPGDARSMMVSEPPPGAKAVLAMVAVDEAGATTPYLRFDRNYLIFNTTTLEAGSPRIHVFSEYVDFTYASGGWSTDPLREIPVEMGSNPSTFRWNGVADPARVLHASRWMLDGDPLDDTPRIAPNDLVHWSDWGPPEGSAALPALSPGVHRLYIELTDDLGGRSLGIVRMSVIQPTLDRELLVIDDTRLEVDKFSTPGTPNTYTRPWPSATELDTFLFARGGYPWRGTRNPTTGVVSTPGTFAGYPFDTLGTRSGLENPVHAVPLQKLASYRHVVVLVDATAATYSEPFDQSLFPISWLRSISRPGVANTLGAYVELGGKVWMAGGGAAHASLATFDRSANNSTGSLVFSSELGELGHGRSLYDHAHIRSAMRSGPPNQDSPSRSTRAIGGWSGHGPSGTLSAPNYTKLPAVLGVRTPATSSLPPTRLASQGSLYYFPNTTKEWVIGANSIIEDLDPDPEVVRMESTLDTLYESPDPYAAGAKHPVMLYYHGRDNVPFVFSGFDLWSWPRNDCQALVDFVLGDLWGLTKSGAAARPARAVRPGAASRSAAVSATRSLRR